MTNDVQLAVIGAGPQALTLMNYVAVHRPQLLQSAVVFDAEDWLAAWHRQFAAYAIPKLRSACVHHPHPHPYGLLGFARARGLTDEFSGSICRPSTGIFADYCEHLIDDVGLRGMRVAQRVVDLRPQPGGNLLIAQDGSRLRAARVVLASNPVRPVVPSWLGEARATHRGEPGLVHAGSWSAEEVLAPDDSIIVIGGGLTAAQIVAAYAGAGRMVTWITRSGLRVRDLDVEASWLGPQLRQFHAAPDPRARVSMARRARGGGSIPAEERQQISALIVAGSVDHLVAPVDRIRRQRDRWQVTVRWRGTTRSVAAAKVICATGSRTHARFEPLLRRCRFQHRIPSIGGLPVLDCDLAWPGTSVHLMGPLAVAAVGPACRTVIGARIASERIVTGLGADLQMQYPGPKG